MTKIKCYFKVSENEFCKFHDKNGYCSKKTIILQNGGEGTANFEACCQEMHNIMWRGMK